MNPRDKLDGKGEDLMTTLMATVEDLLITLVSTVEDLFGNL
jgi:hypothetical protein